ncbi:MAG: hypothetical protein WAM14_23525, partial [Candidatus Nitrosopolaris sp.]
YAPLENKIYVANSRGNSVSVIDALRNVMLIILEKFIKSFVEYKPVPSLWKTLSLSLAIEYSAIRLGYKHQRS